jgi:hypothetical protein
MTVWQASAHIRVESPVPQPISTTVCGVLPRYERKSTANAGHAGRALSYTSAKPLKRSALIAALFIISSVYPYYEKNNTIIISSKL